MCSCWALSRNSYRRARRERQVTDRQKLKIGYSLPGVLDDLGGELPYAFTTLPLRRQDVHTRMRLVAAPTRACTERKFTFQRRLVTLWAWLMRFPNCGFLPQISHSCAMNAIDPFRGLDLNLLFYRIMAPADNSYCGRWQA